MKNLFTESTIRTVSGIYVDLINPTPEMIEIEDIAHGLSMQCRFGGQLRKFYSVAEHSWHVANLVSTENKLAALLHDASEAYLIDIPTPLKKHLTNYAQFEDKFMSLIAGKFGFVYPFVDEIKEADRIMLREEWQFLFLGEGVNNKLKSHTQEYSEANFMWYFNKLIAK